MYALGFIRDRKALCVYCNKRPGKTWDHVIPVSAGGQTVESNLVQACKFCNDTKGNMSAELFREKIRDRKFVRQLITRTRKKIEEKRRYLEYLEEMRNALTTECLSVPLRSTDQHIARLWIGWRSGERLL